MIPVYLYHIINVKEINQYESNDSCSRVWNQAASTNKIFTQTAFSCSRTSCP
ncbi:hypothetical protein GMMP1_1550025 [Candidatus Magnetomoraceae bacterium gMMP-1]